MRLAAFAAALLLGTTAWAQSPLTGTTGPLASSPPGGRTPPSSAAAAPAPSAPTGDEQVAPISRARPHHQRATMQQRFDEANTTHDGRLTQEQARARMPAVARDFAAIDTGQRGYVTVEDIRAYNRAKRTARRAARAAAAPAAPQ